VLALFSPGPISAARGTGWLRSSPPSRRRSLSEFVGTFSLAGPEQSATRPVRRGVVGRVIALGPVIDEAIGETAGLRYLWRGLQAAVDGLFAAISGWRAVALISS
jgi:hypothetical protein